MRCLFPYTKKDGMSFPCGKCLDCHNRRINGWSFRLQKEAEVSTSALFVTLTYNTDNIPITPQGSFTLVKSDLQKFFKRLRKQAPNIRYFACGEYGEQRDRPHYHIILFNALYHEVEAAWTLNNVKLGNPYYGDVTEASIKYTVGYIHKNNIKYEQPQGVAPEFQLSSKGLGKSYLTEAAIRWHKSNLNERYYLPLKDGIKIAIPRYFKEKIYSNLQRQLIAANMFEKESKENLNKTYEEILREAQLEDKLRHEKIRLKGERRKITIR